MTRTAKVTDNEIVSEWLITNRWLNSLNTGTRQVLPGFVDDAVWAAISIVAGVNNGKVNVSPKLVKKCLMLDIISTEAVKRVEYGYHMSDRQARRLAQVTRFALNGIRHRIQEYEHNVPETTKEAWRMERAFVRSYYNGTISPLYSKPLAPIPESVTQLYWKGMYVEYVAALLACRSDALATTSVTES